MNLDFATVKTWCVNNLIVLVPLVLFIILLPIAIISFEGKNENTSNQTAQEETTTTQTSDNTPQRTTDGYIIYDVLSVSMKADEIRTFKVPIGTRVDRYQTSPDKTDIEELDTKNGKYEVRAKKDVTFELVWRIEKGFENKVKPK